MPKSSGFRNTYTSQFVPLPLEQFARTNELNQAKQDEQAAQLAETDDALWKIKGIADEDNAKIGEIKSGFEKASSDLVNKDLTRKENQDAVRGLIKGVARDKDLNTIMTNTGRYQEYLKNREDSIKAGTYQDYNDAGAFSIADYAKSGGYKSGKSIDPTIYKYENVRPVQEQFVDDMSANGSDILKKVGETFYTDGFKGITKNQAFNRVRESFGQYIGTTAANQEARRYDMMVRQGSINPKKLSKEDFLFKGLLDAGLEKVYGVSNTGSAAALNTDRKEKEEAANLGTFASEGQNTLLSGGYSFDFDKDGNIEGSGKSLLEHYKEDGNPGSAIMNWIFDKTPGNNPKDQQGKLISIAAKLNGKTPEEYFNSKAGPDVKLATTFKTLPTKTADAYQKQFFNPATGTGVFNNVPVMNAKTGEKGTLVEILRQAADRGELLNNKGESLSLSKNPTAGEVKNILREAGVGIKGESPSNYFSPKSLMLGIGNLEVLWDRTNNMNPDVVKALEKNGELTPRQVMEHKYEKIKVVPEIEGDEIHYFDDSSGKVMSEKLSNIKL